MFVQLFVLVSCLVLSVRCGLHYIACYVVLLCRLVLVWFPLWACPYALCVVSVLVGFPCVCLYWCVCVLSLVLLRRTDEQWF